MILLALLQGHGGEPAAAGAAQTAEHAAQAAEHAAAGHGEHIPVIVEWINNAIGPAVYSLQAQIMPPIYAIFGGHWPGEGMTYEAYRHAGNLPIPTHVVIASSAKVGASPPRAVTAAMPTATGAIHSTSGQTMRRSGPSPPKRQCIIATRRARTLPQNIVAVSASRPSRTSS